MYQLHGHKPKVVEHGKYLGVTITRPSAKHKGHWDSWDET